MEAYQGRKSRIDRPGFLQVENPAHVDPDRRREMWKKVKGEGEGTERLNRWRWALCRRLAVKRMGGLWLDYDFV